MLKELLFSPENKRFSSSSEYGLIRSAVHRRMLVHQHAVPAAKSAFSDMFSDVAESVRERINNWGKADWLPVNHGVPSMLKKVYSEQIHENSLHLHEEEGYLENVSKWLEIAETPEVPDNISSLENMPASQFIEPGITSGPTVRSDKIIAARKLIDELQIPDWSEKYNGNSGTQKPLINA